MDKYKSMGLVEIKVLGKKELQVSILETTDKLSELESHLKNFLKNIYHSAVASPVELAKNTGVSIDYFSKL